MENGNIEISTDGLYYFLLTTFLFIISHEPFSNNN